ncbi:hypothetical protein BDL97_03G065400 [Sphagnum fallax]|nr:hypothetical protein BDL97_03G065400 [Sphagnum fallax]KAH8967183.1 hypothetical protein BDL97_03G065400 [Sphagnum fallax]KAH8967184.1 hypothetical protein BDL97_03G065400 [Sphagnum fallax]KAH8967185.1 hypothetical protein BDL97_03G065400 [Sphagnum fallax]KAH8967186.1 hypothetical protein BDL97_03G065400 [Sphagnum fallax]
MSVEGPRERRYRTGHEPSAPPMEPPANPRYLQVSPYIDPEHSQYAPSPDRGPSHHPPPSATPDSGALSEWDDNKTLGSYMMDMVGNIFQRAWKDSHTILRIDLRRALSYEGPTLQRRTVAPPISQEGYGMLPGASVSSGGPLYRGEYRNQEEYVATGPSKGWLGGIQGGGARLKLMQVWNLSNDDKEPRLPWNLNFGFGVNVVMDQGQVEPKVRIRAKHIALHLLPEPLLELCGKWPLGNTNLAVNLRYRVPISGIERFWESSNSRLMMYLFHPFGTGVHLTPGGVQFDEHVVRIGEFTTMRVAAALDFPRQFPLEDGEQPVKLRVTRLGLKSKIF